jgi:hypothetical protein
MSQQEPNPRTQEALRSVGLDPDFVRTEGINRSGCYMFGVKPDGGRDYEAQIWHAWPLMKPRTADELFAALRAEGWMAQRGKDGESVPDSFQLKFGQLQREVWNLRGENHDRKMGTRVAVLLAGAALVLSALALVLVAVTR